MKSLEFKAINRYFLLFLSFFLISVDLAFAAENYNLIELNTTRKWSHYATSINNSGVVVGYLNYSDGYFDSVPFKWIDGEFQGLGGVGDGIYFGSSRVFSINDNDEMVGVLREFDYTPAPFILNDGGINILFHRYGHAEAINNNKQIVINNYDDEPYPLFWENGETTEIAVAGIGNAINDRGQVVGVYQQAIGVPDTGGGAFLWENNVLTDLNDLATGGAGGHLSSASDINNSGQIVGTYRLNSSGQPPYTDSSFLFDSNQVTDLGFRGVAAINDIGQIVGSHYIYQGGQLYDLRDLIETDIAYSDLAVRDINNSGQIVGNANINGSARAVILNPTTRRDSFGYEQVFPSISINKNRSALPFAMPEDGTIESVSIYHEGGSGRMLLAVYGGDTLPDNRLAVTASTSVKSEPGWQTIHLTTPVFVPEGTDVFLAWVFEKNPGVRYGTGSPGRARSNQSWSDGMPDPFGASSQRNYLYSIYATYVTNIRP